MCRHRVQVDAKRFDVNWNLACRLYTVGMEVDVCFSGNLADFVNRLDRSNLIIGVHDRDQDRILPDCFSNICGIHQTVVRYRQPRNFVSLLFEVLAGMQNRMMLDLRRNDVPASGLLRFRDTPDGEVIGLGSAA